ncbi:protein-L-isoaspartate O-methyltransferase [Geothermobacter hydrogeniphilus]|uniref:Protein-L-isoaspartate O-methyltransferase n=1 Tax=Geothermobacter hydrogeniphilus TaxID=1969733 RepID=A0A2K2H7G5_9BACT|nr:protein-L-isoaspartate(D-aspartate) O-methyltransferase [Geothermobacter hydrogeniphilus]PNU19254.1 protein-L-isoaspartate O-methyltransferase [Geothermobacter hydrogeniphilus]
MGSAKIKQMLRTIELECESTWRMTGRRVLRQSVMEAMANVPREEFVPPDIKPFAYDNRALPIGNGQTISQPFIVALMTDLLDPRQEHVILEVGTGSGYQAAILSTLVKSVFSIEIISQLATQAANRLDRLGYHNIKVIQGDGYQGLPEQAPFDGIIVTAAASHVPIPLKEQLKPGGKLIIPVGLPFAHQELLLISKNRKGQLRTRSALDVAFVPLTGQQEQ